jgi:hypothetical protein
MKHPMDHDDEGLAINGTPAIHGFYVFINDDESSELLDIAGPFDDEHDAVMAARRIEELAA